MAVEKFVVGNYYRIWPPMKKRPSDFNTKGKMDDMLDGKWRKCIATRAGSTANFSGVESFEGLGIWDWGSVVSNMQECCPKEILQRILDNEK